MSLFPAYSEEDKESNENTEDKSSEENPEKPNTSQWLANSSFPLENNAIRIGENMEYIESSSSSCEMLSDDLRPKHNKSKKKTKKKKHRHKDDSQNKLLLLAVEFNGNEEYYIDKARAQLLLSVRTLHKPACPRYHHSYKQILGLPWSRPNAEYKIHKYGKRYFQIKPNYFTIRTSDNNLTPLEENEYSECIGKLNRKTLEVNCDLKVWLDLLSLQDRNPYKWSRLLMAEKKIDIINRALTRFPCNEQLYKLFIDIVNITYPSFEVTKMLDRLLLKDPYSYTLWTAQIMTTQGSMARCIVPDVLRIYERCMSKMHHADELNASQTTTTSHDSDNIMLRLFNNCALFLRQAGLYEQFIALLKLALELNISTDHFDAFTLLESDQNTLIEFEEIILQSGLPMNEIWLRIEKLRQGFNFLPCSEETICNDPQRIVFNEDICHYIYPLKSRDNSFYLILLMLRLLKVPFIQCEGMAEKFSGHLEQIGDSDAIEDILAIFLRRNFALSQKFHNEFYYGLYTLAKEMTVSPSFLNNMIGHDIYIRCINELLLNCAASYANSDKRKRDLFIVLWCRFQRLLLIIERCSSKLNAEYIKEGRKRFKTLLKQSPNRNVLLLYTEFAIYEFEALEYSKNMDIVQNILENVIISHSANEIQTSDLCYTYVTFAEMLISCGKNEKALQILISYILEENIQNQKSIIGPGKKLAALHKISEKVEQYIKIEKNVEIMVLDQYLLPENIVCLIKVRILIHCLIGQKLEAIKFMDKLINIFQRENERHRFLREHIMELYVVVLQMTCSNCVVPNTLIRNKMFEALNEFPRNLFLLQHCGMLSSEPWFRIRGTILQSQPTILSVALLIVLARCRYIQINTDILLTTTNDKDIIEWDKRCNESIIRNRILHIFTNLSGNLVSQTTTKYALLRNSLFWRLYIRFLSDQCTDFETSRKCLLTALDECPWSKALYLDGATYVPQELPRLQDLIIEKQLRIYALPEELEILRDH